MGTKIFVNLPTGDLERAKAFYTGLGWGINPMFTDDNAACIVVDEDVFLMVLTREYFATFTDKRVIDPHTEAQVQTALSCDSRAAVDAMIERGVAAGGREPRETQDYGFMYSRDLEDPDGNEFGFIYMDPKAAEVGPEEYMKQQSAAS